MDRNTERNLPDDIHELFGGLEVEMALSEMRRTLFRHEGYLGMPP